jgi:hypothetical protein
MSVTMDTMVNIKVNTRKKVDVAAKVIEAIDKKYIKVDLVDEDDHVFLLKWNGFMYEGKILETVLTCQYKVERNFTATKNSTSSGIKPEIAKRSNSGKVQR